MVQCEVKDVNYQYPIDETWTKKEIVDVINFFSLVEQSYENNVNRADLLAGYNSFKQIVPSKSEEKTLFSEFKATSGYSSYHVVKKARESNDVTLKMN